MTGGGGSGINRLGFGRVLLPVPFPSLAPLSTAIRERLLTLGEGSLGPWRGGSQLGPGMSSPHPTSPTAQGAGARSPAQYCQPQGPQTPPPPPQKPLQVRGGVDGASAKEADVGP